MTYLTPLTLEAFKGAQRRDVRAPTVRSGSRCHWRSMRPVGPSWMPRPWGHLNYGKAPKRWYWIMPALAGLYCFGWRLPPPTWRSGLFHRGAARLLVAIPIHRVAGLRSQVCHFPL